MSARAVGAACLAALPLLLGPQPLVAQSDWTELTAARFVLRGRLGAATMNAVACDIAQAERALSVMRGASAPTGDVPIVVAVDNPRDAYEFLPQYWERRGARPLGAYWSGPFGHHILVRVDARPDERLRRIFHEYAHFSTRQAHPDAAPWLDEGLAEVWEHATLRAGAVDVGAPVAQHLKVLQSGRNWLPVANLMSLTSVPATGGNARTAAFYAESWALVHYLMFQKSLGLDHMSAPASLPTDDDLKRYVRGSLGRPLTIPAEAPGADCLPLPASRTSRVEALINRAQALADGERPEAARPLLLAALRLNPGDRRALETLGFVNFAGNQLRESARIFDGLIAAGQGTHIAYYYRALMAALFPDSLHGAGRVVESEYLERAIQLAPDFRPAKDRLREILRKK